MIDDARPTAFGTSKRPSPSEPRRVLNVLENFSCPLQDERGNGGDGGYAGGSGVLGLGHTAHLRLALAEGTSFRSESGVLLTQAATPVPEPSSVILTLLGTGILVRRRWQR